MGVRAEKQNKLFTENNAEAISRATRTPKTQCMLHVATGPTFLHTDEGVTYTAVGKQISFAYAARTCPTAILIDEQ